MSIMVDLDLLQGSKKKGGVNCVYKRYYFK